MILYRGIHTCISGIGNIEPKYKGTRHNVGIEMVRMLANWLTSGQASFQPFPRGQRRAKLEYIMIPDQSLTLVLGNGAYMNESGHTLRPLWQYLDKTMQGPVRHIVIHDELTKPLGKCQLRAPGTSHRGHNGLRDIQQTCGADYNVYKVGIGIDRPLTRDSNSVAQYVLGKFNLSEQETLRHETFPTLQQIVRELLQQQ